MTRRRHWQYAAIGSAALVVGGGLLVTAPWTSRPEDPVRSDAATTAARITAAASALIAEESRGRPPVPAVEAAPALGHRGTAVEPRSADPPEGYSFVRHAGEMRKARIGDPPRGEPSSAPVPDWLDPAVGVPALAQLAADAGRGWSFGWIRLADGTARSGLERALADAGGSVVGGSGRMVRARFPADAAQLAAIASSDGVGGLGAPPAVVKLGAFADGGAQPSEGAVPVYVTLMADDTDGRWRRRMERLGVVVGGYDAELRTYRANVDRDAIRALAELDFVLSVEPIPLVRASHDTAVPAMGADALRAYDGVPGIFVGTDGATVPIAVMDTGLNVAHPDIASHRDSVCGANFAYNSRWHGPDGPVIEEDDLWVDSGEHGTHVTGTVAGNGFGAIRYAGMAPGVRHIRFAKVLDSYGSGSGDSIRQGMDFLGGESGCVADGEPSERVKPLIVNMSLASTARIFEGRDVGARKLDAAVWSHRQLYVVAQSNAGVHGFSNYGAAKNSLSVGAATDGGALASFSSHGPTADSRLAPNVVGTGVRVHSAMGDGSRGGYHAFNGTSMASPAVAGVAALLMDAAPAHKERPALTRARLMASALRPDPWLEEGAGFPWDNTEGPGPVQARFGMGKVSARTAVLDRDGSDGWRSGGATSELADGEYAWHDIEVPAGASRLDLVMTWDEPPADAVASTVLNDLDLWLDRDGDCGTAACGERASRSRVDNVEWIVVRDPEPGTWRAKVVAHRVFSDAPRAALAWTVVRGASTPTLSVEADRERIAGPGEHELTLTLAADAYVAAGTRLHVDCRSAGERSCNDLVSIESAAISRQDGVVAGMAGEALRPVPSGFSEASRPIRIGASIPIGEIAAGERREVVLRIAVAEGGEGEANLHFTASAWNGRAGSVAVPVGSGDAPDVARADNDAFAVALAISGRQGSASLDLLDATPEPGEPVVDPWNGTPAGSVWYLWTAPEDGLVRFAVAAPSEHTEDNGGIARYDHVHVFQGEAVSGLRETASGLWRTTFVAERGQRYVVRVAGSARGTAMDLRWSPGERPANDDFADAVRLEGESGSVEGSNADATLERGESFGTLAATTWYRWTAPGDGRWEFRSRGRRVLVFEGDQVADLRLVGWHPASTAVFPVGEGREYRIAVTSNSPEGGGPYSLAWSTTGPSWDNDDFLDAEAWGESPSRIVAVNSIGTVEPGEPAGTGVRTRWWNWQAPDDGRYTWRLEDDGETVPLYPKMQLRIFRGNALETLAPAAQIGPGGPFETILETRAAETWRISAGVGDGDEAAFNRPYLSGRLVWGATPENDEPGGAAPISGTSGSVSGSIRFATGAAGERSADVGRSTLWWSYEADESRWVRFAVDSGDDWVLTVHRAAADGSGGLDVVTSSRLQYGVDDVATVVFLAERGVRYTISLGVADGGRDGEFTLRWDETDDPGWLRYAGRIADGGPDSLGDPVEIRSPAALTVNASGTALYLASELGLQVFGRDPATGGLSYAQLLDAGPFLGDARLLWDASRDRLVADECGSWRSFVPVGDGPELEDLGALEALDDPGTCAVDLLLDASGSHVYRIGARVIEHFVVEGRGGLRLASSVDHGATYLADLVAAVLSHDDGHLYARTRDHLWVLRRNRETGSLTLSGSHVTLPLYWSTVYGPPTRMPLATTDDDAFLFVFDRSGQRRVGIYSLDDPDEPDLLATLEPFWEGPDGHCRFADARTGIVAVDAFCPGVGFTAKWDPQDRRLAGSHALLANLADGAGPSMPEFGAPVALAAAPDDRHVYLATPREGILIFARDAGHGAVDDGDAPDLAVQRIWSTPVSPTAGSTFRLSALVRNRGSGRSASAMLSFHRSGDGTVTPSDPSVGSVPLGVVDPAGTRSRSVEVEAPPRPGTYHYGACIEGGQECSEAVSLTVIEALPGAPDLMFDAVSVDAATVDPAASFALTVVVRNIGDAAAPATTVRYFRSDNATVSTGDVEVGTDKIGGLAPGADREVAVTLTAPEEGGIHYYGACADAVEGEVRTRDNCSDSVAVEVSGGDGGGRDDDHGDSIGDATPLSIPSATDAELESEGDRDYFRVEVGEPTALAVETEGGTDTYGTLFDADGISLASDDDGGFSLNFRIEREVDAGIHYVEVRGFSDSVTGPYTLRVSADDGDEEAAHCRSGGTVEPDDSCAIYGTAHTFDVDAGGQGCLNAGFSLCSGGSISYRSASLTFVAERLDDDSWEVEDVDPAPPD